MEKSVEVVEDQASPPAETSARRVPRLRIVHFLMWTLVTALYLTANESIRSLDKDSSKYDQIVDVTGAIGGIAIGAVSVAAAVLLQARLRQGPPLCSQPGHWLSLIISLSALCWLPLLAVCELMKNYGIALFFVFSGVVSLAQAAAYLSATICQQSRRWIWFFFLAAGARMCQAAEQLTMWTGEFRIGFIWLLLSLPQLLEITLCPWLFTALYLDRRAGLARDWVHWCGVVAYLVLVVPDLVLEALVFAWFVSVRIL